MQFSRHQYWILALLSGLILAISWPMRGFAFASFFAFIPLFLLEDSIRSDNYSFKSARIFAFSFLSFVIWNLLTTYWIKNAAMVGLLMALLVNGSLMALAFLAYHKIRNQFSNGQGGQILLIFPWLSFEYLHLDWELTWSWMNLGNAFGPWHQWVQWYEFTGAFGGSVWVLLLNVLLYAFLRTLMQGSQKQALMRIPGILALFLIPSAISFWMYQHYSEESNPVEVVVVQPNIDPYIEKYGGMPYKQQIALMLDLARQKTDAQTRYVVFPESAIQESLWETRLDRSYSIDSINLFLAQWPQTSVVMGASTYKKYLPGEPLRVSARYLDWDDSYYDAYNTTLFMEKGQETGFYHKSKLVAGVEHMPFTRYLKFINNLAVDLGGIVGTLGRDDVRKVFSSTHDSLKVSTVICYESVYGEFFSTFVANGAELMFIITNDGWWGDTPGYKQHFYFAPLRAIETRRSIARSANTGISGFINQRGDIIARSAYWEKDVMKGTLNANRDITFYVKYGDYLGRVSVFVTLLFLLISFTRRFLRKKGKLS